MTTEKIKCRCPCTCGHAHGKGPPKCAWCLATQKQTKDQDNGA